MLFVLYFIMKLSQTLIGWYSVHKRNLPWRNTVNPYYIWLSEIILQQTQVAQGLPYYESFVANYPTIFDLAKADEQQVLKLWQGLGYYSRARNLHASAKFIATDLAGVFPSTYEEIKKLKGVGDYTASAIASICFNEPTAVLDGNVYRLLARYYGIDTPINTGKGFKVFKAMAEDQIDRKQPAEFNQAVMEFGARQCKPKSPDCTVCPLIESCVAYSQGRIDSLPVKLKASKAKKKHFNFMVVLSEDKKTILEQRETKGIWQNLYQFPLIETEISADLFLINKELKNYEPLLNKNFELSLYNETEIIHKLSHQHLYTKFWIVQIKEGLKSGVALEELHKYPVPVLIGKFIEQFNF